MKATIFSVLLMPFFLVSSICLASAQLERDLSVAQVKVLYESKQAYLIDVREPWEYKKSYIQGVTLIPLKKLSKKLEQIPKDQPVILVCASGFRSDKARNLLEYEGFNNVHNMLGGMQAWEEAGYQTRSR